MLPSHGLCEDRRVQIDGDALWFPDYGSDGLPIPGSGRRFSGDVVNAARRTNLFAGIAFSPDEIVSPDLVTHLLVRGLTEPLVREAVTNGRAYAAHDALCDPTGFMFGAVNNLGVFNIGDPVMALGKSKVRAETPVPAKLRLFYGDKLIQEASGTNLIFETQEPGAYRIEARLVVAGEELPWIYSNPVYLKAPDAKVLAGLLPSMELSPGVERRTDITYTAGSREDAGKHKLDVYLSKGATNAPVLFFLHGGAWKMGDRSQYVPLGNRFAREGYVTVIPSYRLAPRNPHPAQIEDATAAFAWTVQHVAEFGGDTNRIYVSGHSAGGHLAGLLSLDEKNLAAYQLSPRIIRGVLAWSGVYDLTESDGFAEIFGKDTPGRQAASPLFHVQRPAPPFLVTYCEWEYYSLPAQAKKFYAALRQAGISAELVYVPGQSHISEMLNITKDTDVTATTALQFMKQHKGNE